MGRRRRCNEASSPALAPPLGPTAPAPAAPRERVPWAELLRRRFATDLLQCPRCHGRMRVLALITDRPVVAQILEHLGLSTTGPPLAPPRRSPQLDLVA